jgi:hypothetical protein
MRILFLLTLISLLSFSCEKSTENFELGEEISLKYDGKAQLKDGGNRIQVRFTDIIEDSRCPPTALCLVAGSLIIELQINENDFVQLAMGDAVTRAIDPIPSSVVYEGVRFTLLNEVGGGIDSFPEDDSDYIIGLRAD